MIIHFQRGNMYNKFMQLKEELKFYHRDRKFLEKYYINKRLNDSLESYYKDLKYSLKYLENRKAENIFKKMGD